MVVKEEHTTLYTRKTGLTVNRQKEEAPFQDHSGVMSHASLACTSTHFSKYENSTRTIDLRMS